MTTLGRRTPILDRFWDKVCPEPNTGCWLWTGETKKGYGRISTGGREGRLIAAHRLSWTLFKSPVDATLEVCHRCDVRRCVNPDHLFLGTHGDNMRDMIRKGRHRLSARTTKFVWSPDAVEAMKQLSEAGWSGARIARAFGADVDYVYRILGGKRWSSASGA